MAHYWIAEYPFKAKNNDLRLCHVFIDGEHMAHQMSVTQAMLWIVERIKSQDTVGVEWMGYGLKQFSADAWKSMVRLIGLKDRELAEIPKGQRRNRTFEQSYLDAVALEKMQGEADFYRIEVEYAASDSVGPEIWWNANWTVTVITHEHGELVGYSERSLADALEKAEIATAMDRDLTGDES